MARHPLDKQEKRAPPSWTIALPAHSFLARLAESSPIGPGVMHGMHMRRGIQYEEWRERLRQLGRKARRDPKSLPFKELDELCTLVSLLKPRI